MDGQNLSKSSWMDLIFAVKHSLNWMDLIAFFIGALSVALILILVVRRFGTAIAELNFSGART